MAIWNHFVLRVQLSEMIRNEHVSFSPNLTLLGGIKKFGVHTMQEGKYASEDTSNCTATAAQRGLQPCWRWNMSFRLCFG